MASTIIQVAPFQTKKAVLVISNISSDQYVLFGRIINLDKFYKEAPIAFLAKVSSTYIQTDKATYKPNDVINFRAVILDYNLNAFDTSKGHNQVYVSDSNGNRIKQFDNVTFVSGVYKNKVLLSDNPPLGAWKIVVVINGESESKDFVVNKYVLPTFSIDITTFRHITFSDEKIIATIDSKYTYGQYVSGLLTVNVYRTNGINSLKKNDPVATRQYPDFDGNQIVEFSFSELDYIPYETNFIINGSVKEDLTGKTASNEATISVHQYAYKIVTTGESNFKPGFTYEGDVTISFWDKSPVIDESNIVSITVTNVNTYNRVSPQPNTTPYSNKFNVTINNGVAHFVFTTPLDYNTLQIVARYKEITSRAIQIRRENNEINEYIQMKIETSEPRPNGRVSVAVIGTNKLKYITYIIVSRGNIISSKTIKIKNSYTALFEIKVTYGMIPSATILAFYVSEYGQFVSDSVDLKLPRVYQNYIKIDIEDEIVKPGSEVNIKIKTRPHSYVGIMGVDQSVILLKSGNDFDNAAILDSLSSYNGVSQTDSSYPEFYVSVNLNYNIL